MGQGWTKDVGLMSPERESSPVEEGKREKGENRRSSLKPNMGDLRGGIS